MSADMFLKIEGVEGEAVDHKHGGEIDVLAWSWGMTQSGSMHIGGGGGAGKVSVDNLTVTKYVDKSTPNLINTCCTGKHYKEAIRLKPNFAEAYSNLAKVYYQFKQGKDAIENLLVAQRLFDEQDNKQMVATAQSLLQDLYKEFNMSREDFPN